MLDQTPATHPDLARGAAVPRRPSGHRWGRGTLVQFGYMVGLGFSGPQIGAIIGCTTASVANACRRHGVQLARRRNWDVVQPVTLSKETAEVLDGAAAMRGITRQVLIERILVVLGEDEDLVLIDNVLDDMGEL